MVTSNDSLSCIDAETCFSEALDEPGSEAAARLREHLPHCPDCQKSFDAFQKVTHNLSDLETPRLRRDLVSSINERIDERATHGLLPAQAVWAIAALLLLSVLVAAGFWLSGGTLREDIVPAKTVAPGTEALPAKP